MALSHFTLLELFSGTGSVEKVAKQLGYAEVISLDNDPSRRPTISTDIMSWDYKAYPSGYFNVIWASPPCTYYSSLQYNVRHHKDRKGIHYDLEALRQGSDQIISRVLEIIDYFKPQYWIMENPWSGALKSRAVVNGLPYIDADYCQYGYPYRKRTRFWTNRLIQLKLCNHDCAYSSGRRHTIILSHHKKAEYGSNVDVHKDYGFKNGKDMRYSIPAPLLSELLPHPRIKVNIKLRSSGMLSIFTKQNSH